MATILIVDDDPYICQLLCDLVEDLGHTPLSAMNGQAALEIARSRHPDLILTDVMMPVLDGYGLVQALRTDPSLSKTAVFLMSAAFSNRKKASAADEVTGFIEKPFDLLQIEQLLRGLVV